MNNYRLKSDIISIIRDNPVLKNNLCKSMNIDTPALNYHLANNLPNGSMTKYFALSTIAEFMKCSIESLVEQATYVKESKVKQVA